MRLNRFMAFVAGALALGMLAGLTRADEPIRPDWTSAAYERSVVAVLHDAYLESGEHAREVVAVLGNATADGSVSGSVVAVLGDSHANDTVGDSVVAVLGNAYVNSKVSGGVVAILGNVTLGPQADVSGGVVQILGHLERSPTAHVQGDIARVFTGFWAPGLQAWLHECLFYGRLLSFDPGVRWAWGLALAALGLYVLIALLFPGAVSRCAQVLGDHPGESLLAALLGLLLSPLVFVVLVVTLIGIALVPIVWLSVNLFGKAVALAWLGNRCLGGAGGTLQSTPPRTALAVLLGGLVALALYLVPVLGMLMYALLGVLGVGAVLYAIVLGLRGRRDTAANGGVARPGPGSHREPYVGTTETGANPNGSSANASADTPYQAAAAGAGASGPSAGSRYELSEPTLQPRAGFWIRMGALALDVVLIGVVLGLLQRPGPGEVPMLAIYGAIMWKLKATTVGGAICHLKVVRLDGRPLDWGTAIVRALGCFLSLAVAGLGFIWIAVDPEHQAWHDKIAGTVVVRMPESVPLL